jgi:alkane 1-monooxygenase
MQAITYIQHWGLSDRLSPDLAEVGYSWEDRCVMQAWVTLNHAYHGHHHRRPSLPFFRLGGLDASPRLPASYPVMLLVALVPPVFKRVMRRQLDEWCDAKGTPILVRRRSCGDARELFRK